MPLNYAVKKSPSGMSYVRTISSGTVTGDEAQHLMTLCGPGNELEGLPLLNCMDPGASFSSEGRKILATFGKGTKPMPLAFVVTNGPLRIVLSFIIRMNRSIGATRFVATEEEGLKWLARAPRPAVPMSRSKRPPTGQTGR